MRRLGFALAAFCLAAPGRQPSLLEFAAPKISPEARAARLSGVVLLSVNVGRDGRARDVRIVKPLGLGLDQNAVEAVSLWKFAPAIQQGDPVAAEVVVRVSFPMIAGVGDWRLDAAGFDPPEGALRPVLTSARYPEQARHATTGRVSLLFQVDANGIPVNIQVRSATDSESADEVIALVREWRFQAALRGGVAIPVNGYLDFAAGPNRLPESGIVTGEVRPRKMKP